MAYRYFLSGIVVIVFFSLLGCEKAYISTKPEKQVNFPAPESILIGELPDSLAPQRTYLKDRPAPVSVKIPKQTGGFYHDFEGFDVPLEAPLRTNLLTLTDSDARELTDDNGDPFILGSGGVSDFTTYTTDDGLALDAVNCALLDSRGHLWFGTSGGGVSRFDGTTFTTYSASQGLADNSVLSILEDSKGNLWFGTLGGGISKYDGKLFTSYSTDAGLLNGIVYDLIEDKDGLIWAGTLGGGLSRLDGDRFTNFTEEDGLSNNNVVSLLEDENGFLWVGTYGGGLSRFDGNEFVNFDEEDGLTGNRIRSLYQDREGLIWIGITGSGISTYDGKNFTHYDQTDGLAGLVVRDIMQTQDGTIWLATNEGASMFEKGRFISYRRPQGLPSDNLNAVTEDQNGKLWFTSEGGGISRFDGRGFSNFSTLQGLGQNIVMSLVEDQKGNLWIGTQGGGVSKYDGKQFETYSITQGLSSDIVYSSYEDSRGYLWFGTGGGGVCRYDGNILGNPSPSFTVFTSEQGLAGNDVFSIFEDQKGNIWFGTDGGGLSIFDGESFYNLTSDTGLAGDAVFGIEEDHLGNIWIATLDGGLSLFRQGRIYTFTEAQGLADIGARRVRKDSKGDIWVGTDHGLSLVAKEKIDRLDSFLTGDFSEPLFETISTSEGLPDDNILQIAELPSGQIAVGTNLGIAVFNCPAGAESGLDSLAQLEIFNSQFGFPVKDLTDGQNGMYIDSKGILWAGTGSNSTALVRFDYSALKKNRQKPEVSIREIQINETSISWYNLELATNQDGSTNPASREELAEEMNSFGRNLTERERNEMLTQFSKIQFDGISPFFALPQELVLPFKNNQVNINFSTNELAKPGLIEYRYFLEGYDQNWSPVIKKSSASFGNIQEGDYTFNVVARYIGPVTGDAGAWSDPVSYSFTVLPPWYRSWWAYLIYAFLFISLIYPITQYQKKQVIKKEQEKARERELEQAREIEKAYTELEASHENLKATQSQLIQSEKMASLGELTAGIAHEIQNPLNFVNNFSEVSKELMEEMEEELKRGDKDEVFAIAADIKDNLERISSHGRRADSIVKAMLQHSRTGTGNKEETDINALADECLRLSYHAIRSKDPDFRVEYTLDLDPTLPKTVVIPQDIGKVFLNITNNAFYATNEWDKQRKDLEYLPVVQIKTKRMGNKIEIQVRDNGPGVPEEVREKIFQPFFTTKPTGKGTGLGLSLSYDIIKAHGGELKVLAPGEMPDGKMEGSVFSIILPLNT
ncbi:two-component regulator propeller domain-containing protein [Algoriphagus namhaensis]